MLNDLLKKITLELADPRNRSREERFTKARIVFAGLARANGFSHQEIADAIGKDRATIYHYERCCNEKNLGKEFALVQKIFDEIRNTDSPNREAKDGEIGRLEETPSSAQVLGVQG